MCAMVADSFRSCQITSKAFGISVVRIASEVYWRYLISSELMGVTKKAKVTFTCEPNLKDGLEEWARSESRTLSNLIEMLIRQAYEIHHESSSSTERPDPNPTTSQPASATKAKRGKGSKEDS